MTDDVKSYIYGTIIVFIVGVMAWVGFLYLNACGFTLTCHRGDLQVVRTPVPTLIPATMPIMGVEENSQEEATTSDTSCQVVAADLIETWVNSGVSETETFQFTDANGLTCETTFEEAKPLLDTSQPLSELTIFVGKPIK
ncbi:MAG: hypothetical protein HC797_01690 [Anaerolineales bacterium]|nr:hypothetical protein [Anaerolineales bacterium]